MATGAAGGAAITGGFSGSVTFGSTTLKVPAASGRALYVAGVDSKGTITWATGGNPAGSLTEHGLARAPGGGFFLASRFLSPSSFGTGSAPFKGSFVARLSATGSPTWVLPLLKSAAPGLASDTSGDLHISAINTGGLGIGGADSVYAKLSGQGKLVRAVTFGSKGPAAATFVVPNAGGGVVLAGVNYDQKRTQLVLGKITLDLTKGNFWVAGLDAKGDVTWAFSTGAPFMPAVTGMDLDSKGNLVLAGFISGGAYLGPHKVVSRGSADLFVWKIQLP